MRIVAITPNFYPHKGGGENYVLNLGIELAKKHEFTVICPAIRKKGRHQIGNIEVYYLPYKTIFGTDVISTWHMYNTIRLLKPNIIHGHGPSVSQDIGLFLSKILRIPMVTTYHASIDLRRTISRIYMKFCVSIVLRNMEKVIVTSKSTYSKMQSKTGIHRSNIVFIPVGVHYDIFNNVQNANVIRQKFDLKEKKIVLFVGRLDNRHLYKRLDLLINSITLVKKKIQNIHLMVVGDGGNISQYRLLVQSLGIQNDVSFHTDVRDDELPYWYSAADAFVLPSPSDEEGFGIVLLEAMSAGIPVITSDACWWAFSIQEGKSGLLYKAYDIDDLSCKIITILTNDALSSEMTKNGKEYAKAYDWKVIVKAVESIYLGAIGQFG
jgi:glycosyltransferase involved in cell wall biosynthesis